MTDEMKNYFEQRQQLHVNLVKKYLDKAIAAFSHYENDLLFCKETHDDSKKYSPEHDPYVYISWKHHCQAKNIYFEVPKEIETQMNDATFHHVKNNKHHPEYWDTYLIENPINKENRDEPSGTMVSAIMMPIESVIEMVCDWCAVSEERGTNPYDWANNNIGVRWDFSEGQVDAIYEVLDAIWQNK